MQVKAILRFYLTLFSLTKMTKEENNKCWGNYEKINALVPCWWSYELVWLLWKAIWNCVQKIMKVYMPLGIPLGLEIKEIKEN